MSTADHSLSAVLPTPAYVEASWWVRIGKMMQTAWHQRPAAMAMPAARGDRQALAPPVAGKITAISVAGWPALPVAAAMSGPARDLRSESPRKIAPHARRPGVQGRWKASDRVAML
ncbi:MAG: hypothetical protein ABI790_12530 [Betaproteobacteria bacterium]